MRLLCIGGDIDHPQHTIDTIACDALETIALIDKYDYIVISGGDGTLRRSVEALLKRFDALPPILLHPTGSFNVIAKHYRISPIEARLQALTDAKALRTVQHTVYTINDRYFLFSAGNMGDAMHIMLSETLRFGFLKSGALKYLLAFVLLLPAHLLLTPFMLLSQEKFFIFTPLRKIKRFGRFFGDVETLTVHLSHSHHYVELDGDLVLFETPTLHIRKAGHITLVT